MANLALYIEHVTTENGVQITWVRKERLEELQRMFDAVCASHTVFVDKIHEAVCGHREASLKSDSPTLAS